MRVDVRDAAGGGLLTVVGLVFSWYAVEHYELGSLQRMGPGMFPAGLGLILAFFGVQILAPACLRTGKLPQVRFWAPLFVLGGLSAFALCVERFGLIPAILAVTIISSLAELRVRLISLSLLCAGLCLFSWLIFQVGLGNAYTLVNWPF